MRKPLWIMLLLAMLLALVALPGAGTAETEEVYVTIGIMPESTRNESVVVRGVRSAGALVDVYVNGELQATGNPEGALYSTLVTLSPGENEIMVVATLDEAMAMAQREVFRRTVLFEDVGDYWWAQDQVEVLATLGVVNGIGAGLYGPQFQVTRAQFARMISLAIDLPEAQSGALTFADAAAIPDWAAVHVAAAVENGIITGFEDNTFRANEPITRAQIAVMVARALRLRLHQPTGQPVTFTDAAQIPGWAAADVDLSARAGVITGFEDGSFGPSRLATRAEAGVMVYRMWKAVR